MPTLPERSDRLVMAAVPLILIATVLSATQGGLAGISTLPLALAVTFAIARRVAVPSDLRFVMVVSLGTLVLRAIAAGVLDVYLTDRTAYRALFHDDAAYINYAKQMAAFWNGADIGFPDDPSVRNSYAIGIGLLFSVIGENVMVVRLVNSFSLAVAALLTYRTMVNLGLPGPRLGLLGVLVFPSLTLWSILSLKDTYVALWMVVAVWAGSQFLRSGRYAWYLPTMLALLVLDGARRYVFLVLALAWPLGLLIAAHGRRRLVATGLAVLCSLSLMLASGALATYTPETIGALSAVRAGMARGARSALVDPAPVIRGRVGERYLVTVSGDPMCAGQGQVVKVPIGSKVVVRVAGRPAAPLDPSTVYVAPCDVIVLVDPRTLSSGPSVSDPETIVLVPEARNTIDEVSSTPPDPTGLQRGLVESLIYLPTGLMFVVTAPFPLSARTPSEIAAIPEMLLWYGAVALGAYGFLLLLRARNLGYAFGAFALGGIAFVLSLAEGNAGTLVRHRAMAIVFVVVLAAVGLDALLARRTRACVR